MPLDMNDAAPQKTFEVIPDGVFAKVLLQVKGGGYTLPGADAADNGLFRTPKSEGSAVTMECEFTVLEGPYAHRKFIEYWTVAGGDVDDKGHSKGWNISKTRIRAAIESNQGIKPDDMGPQAVATRRINNFSELQNLWFFAKIGVDFGNEYADPMTGAMKMGFDKNKIDRIITPDMVEYADMAAGKPVEPKPSGRQRKAAGATASAPGNAPARSWGGAPAAAKPAELPLGPTPPIGGTASPKPSWLNKG
jgi:hypothetical protein